MKNSFVGGKFRRRFAIGLLSGAAIVLASTGEVRALTADFQLLTSSTVIGKGASTSNWLTFPDTNSPTGHNPYGTYSFNFVDPAGALGALGFAMSPALTGNLQLQFQSGGGSLWNVSASSLSYAGQVGPLPAQAMNQYLNDTNGTGGSWDESGAVDWAIQYNLNFFLAAAQDGDPSPTDKDAIFVQATQTGYLLPVSALTPSLPELLFNPGGISNSLSLKSYLLSEIQPALPTNATYLLLTWMNKTNPFSTDTGLPITTNSLVGNMTVAYTTSTVPEPSSMMLLTLAAVVLGFLFMRRNRVAKTSRN